MPDFLLEVGTEELPASFIDQALDQWQRQIPPQLTELGLPFTGIEFYGTPRRLALLIRDIAPAQADRLLEIKGPALASAYVDGNPTKALQGFMRSKGLAPEDLVVRDTDKGQFVYGRQQVQGRDTREILAEKIGGWITGLEGKRLMRWGWGDVKFPRPIRWLVALWDDQVLPCPVTVENLTIDRYTQGHRVLCSQPIEVTTAGEYAQILAEGGVIVDRAKRAQIIQSQIHSIEQELNAQVKVPGELLAEVVNLVEYPTAIVGDFEPEFLTLPPEVIETEMISHQRYFPVYRDGQILPHFITISNGDPRKAQIISAGNGRVIRARLSDGKFFFDSDRAVPLSSLLPQLAKVTFQEQLGSVADKVARMLKILPLLCHAIPNLNLTDTEEQLTKRSIELCKADLVSQMVKEFPELQGIMGGYYARSSGEPEAVAVAIRELYQTQPSTLVGQLTAICDRLDTLVGIFSVGIVPTGSSDPFALRRSANSILQMAWQNHFQLNLPQLLKALIPIYSNTAMPPEQLYDTLIKWLYQRCVSLLQDMGLDYDLVAALFGKDDPEYQHWSLSNLDRLAQRGQFLQACRQDGSLARVREVVHRAERLAQGAFTIDPSHFSAPAEVQLYEALQNLVNPPANDRQLLDGLVSIAPVLAQFFDAVMVMAEDPQQRANRLGLLQIIRDYSRQLADFSCIVSG